MCMLNMKTLEKDQIVNEKVYQLRKSFYDMALLRDSTKNLNTILTNIDTLEIMTQSMIDVGYAKIPRTPLGFITTRYT